MKLFIYLLLQVLIFMPIVSFAAEGNLNSLVQNQKTEVTEAQKAGIIKTYGKLPLYFIENNGQVNRQVSFYERGAGHATFFTSDGVVLSLSKSDEKVKSPIHTAEIKGLDARKNKKITTEAVRLSFVGANKDAKIIADEKMPGHVNYFIGNNKSKWRSNIPTYGAVTYKDVYKNIDITFYGNNKNIEHDVIVRPGGDPSKVKFAYKGIKGLKIKEDGDLEVSLTHGKFIEKRPVLYQEINGRKVPVKGSFRILKGKDETFTYAFNVAPYDKTKDLIIDPALDYSTYLGGNEDDVGNGIAVDSSGNAYVTGYTYATDFPLVNPIYGIGGGSYRRDAFVTKINPSGTAIVYSTYLGGSSDDGAETIAVDSSGAAYVTGMTVSTDFPLTNPIQGILGGFGDAFVTKINSAGSVLVYSTYLGGLHGDWGYSIAVDSSGAAYVTGSTNSSDFPLMSPIQGVSGGGEDTFITKVNPAGTALVYSTYLGGSDMDWGYGIAVDAADAAYVTGKTSSPDFPLMSPIQGTFGGLYDSFITKVNSAGTAFVYSTYLGGTGADQGNGVAVDSSGAVFVAGSTNSPDFPLMNPLKGTIGGGYDSFITKINPAGTGFLYSTYLGGNSGSDYGYAIAVDTSGNAYVTGKTSSPDFPLMSPIQGSLVVFYDTFITKINPVGTALVYSTYLGGIRFDYGYSIAVDASDNAYVTGQTYSPDFPLMSPIQGTMGNFGGSDAFLSKIGSYNNAPIANAGLGQNIFLTETAYLDGSASSDPDGDPIVSYTWTINSAPAGSTAVLLGANTVTPNITPDLPGQYFVSLVVSDGKNNSFAVLTMITATQNKPPIAIVTGVPTTGFVPLTVNFDASGSSDPEGGALSYSWDFGDMTTGVGVSPSHTYTTVGTFTAIVTVTDDFGLSSQTSITISVMLHDIMLSLSPDATSIARGSTLGYRVTATNTTATGQCFEYWENVTLPNSLQYPIVGELFGPINICLNAGASKSAHLTHGVPISAPVGSYIFNAYVGTHPTPIIINAHFNFNVTAFNPATKHPQRSWRLIENGFK